MAYARLGEADSDVYVWRGVSLSCGCSNHRFTAREMVMHLIAHVRENDNVPDFTFERLLNDIQGVPYETAVEEAIRLARKEEKFHFKKDSIT